MLVLNLEELQLRVGCRELSLLASLIEEGYLQCRDMKEPKTSIRLNHGRYLFQGLDICLFLCTANRGFQTLNGLMSHFVLSL
jgi:hypothetical protein